MKVVDRGMAFSYPTICTSLLAAMPVLHDRADEGKVKLGSAILGRLHPYPPAIGLDDRPADREAQAHAIGLRADEGREQLVGDLRRYPGAGVGHDDLHKTGRAGTARHRQPAHRTIGHRADGVAAKVDKEERKSVV